MVDPLVSNTDSTDFRAFQPQPSPVLCLIWPMRPPRPRPKLSLWVRLKAWLRQWKSPLQLRRSITRLHHQHNHPVLTLVRLFIPFPSWYFPVPTPVSPRALIEDTKNQTGIIKSRYQAIHNLRWIPIWCARDTPLRSIYRLYDFCLADHYEWVGNETEYFFFREDWNLRDVPDPRDEDPIRYAMIASLMEELHDAVNWRLSLGLRRDKKHVYRNDDTDSLPPFIPQELPDWTKEVPPIDKDLLRQSVPPEALDPQGNLVLEEGGTSHNFACRNIITNTGWLYTI